MSKFSNKLKELFSIKSVDKRMVAQALDMDRALLYRYLNDQSFPEDTSFIDQLRNELYLTPYEYKELQEAYRITKLGEHTYHNRMVVARILDKLFSQNQPALSDPSSCFSLENKEISVLPDRDSIYFALQQIIMDSRTTELLMNFQPDRDFVNVSIFHLLKEKASRQTTSIQHILRFQSKTSNSVSSYNLEIFSELLPLLYYCTYYTNSSYSANYYYNNQAAVDERAMDLFPNILVTPWCTVTMSFNYDNGILYQSETVSAMYRKSFEEIKKNTFAFLSSDNSSDLSDRCRKNVYRDYVFKVHPSASLALGEEFYSSPYMAKTFDIRGLEIRFEEYHQTKQEILYSPTHQTRSDFFTATGLKHFLETGELTTFFSDYALPLEKKDILAYLKRYVKTIEDNPTFSTHLIQDDVLNRFDGNFGIFIFNDNSLVIENSRRKLYHITSVIEVTEKSIVDAFCDYLDTGILSEASVLSREATLEILKEKIKELEG